MFAIPSNDNQLNAPPNGVHGSLFLTATQSFTVPDLVHVVWISQCDAGTNGSAGNNGVAEGAGGNGGRWTLKQPVLVTPGMVVLCTIGQPSGGATTFGNFTIATFGSQLGIPTTNSASAPGQAGGSCPFFGIGGSRNQNSGAVGEAGIGFGAGGQGGGDASGSFAGGAGAPGAMIIEW